MQFRSDCTEGQDRGKNKPLKVQVQDIKIAWKRLWKDRFNDKLKAEGISRQNYPLLFIDRGTVIVATRDFKPLDFKQVLKSNGIKTGECFDSPHPSVGGYGKFSRNVLNTQKRFRKWKANKSVIGLKPKKVQTKQKEKKGWLHYKMK